METTHQPYRPRGVPRWTFWAAVPVVLAMGFVTGMAIATYTADEDTQVAKAEPTVTVPAIGTTNPLPQPASPQTDTSWQIPVSIDDPPRTPGLTGEHPLETNSGPTAPVPAPAKFTGPATKMDDAKKALTSDFGFFSHQGAFFRVEYQIMTHTNRGRSLAGIINLDDYPGWEKAVSESPVALTAWLQKAAERVLEATRRDGFHIGWAVIASPDQRPAGFADYEVTPMDNGKYLVIRRLASTLDHTKTEISLRSLTSLQQSAANKAVTAGDPWATYGPAIHFDGTDVYRPIGLAGAKPR